MSRKRKNFIFTDKSHAIKGVMSSVFALLSAGLLVLAVYLSYEKQGQAGITIGSIGLWSMIIAMIGVYLGVISFWEKEKYYFFSKTGTLLNVILFIIWCAIFFIGL